MSEETPLVQAAKATEQFPNFFVAFIAGTIISICSDPLVLSLSLGSVMFGIVTRRISTAGAMFWLLYALLRTVSGLSNAVVASGQAQAAATIRSAQPYVTPQS